ncbi:unnamed protein product [Adineta steineri]|uniref:Uncharacterized protein n=1 Tax=Adineta steineri TaxID=433720 RepID=A0A819NIQ0_9BILA|nr:unnamed protein product [Adineta steineri]CAF3999645.1 unnamed protein product [Adineta steineri]
MELSVTLQNFLILHQPNAVTPKLIRNPSNTICVPTVNNSMIMSWIEPIRYAARFIGDASEWIIIYYKYEQFSSKDIYAKARSLYGKDRSFEQLITCIIQNYLEKDSQDVNNITNIKQYFEQALHEKNPIHLLKAYTANNDFYLKLNFQPKLETLSYIGTTCRGMIINNDNFQQYKIGKQILIKTFLSTSKHISVASQFCKKIKNQMIN